MSATVTSLAEFRSRRRIEPPPVDRWKIVGGKLVGVPDPMSSREEEILRRLYENEPMDDPPLPAA